MTTTKTTNRIHLEDLDPSRFEDLCLAIIYPMLLWKDIRHYGRMGTDGGVDIFATEEISENKTRNWFFQCKRYSTFSAVNGKKAIDEILSRTKDIPEQLVLIISCDVSKRTHEAIIEYGKKHQVPNVLIWSQSFLEAKLYCERKDLLFTYFGISEASRTRSREKYIIRNLALKKRMQKDFIKPHRYEDVQYNPSGKFVSTEAIIHSIDDSDYPSISEQPGISSWFKLWPYDFYHNGVEFLLHIVEGIINKEGKWREIGFNEPFDVKQYKKIKLFKVACIPFRNIIDYNLDGDEFYACPHIYCTFADSGTPYEEIRYYFCKDQTYPHRMNDDDHIKI